VPTYVNKGNYLLVESDEPYSLALFMVIIHEIAQQCKQSNLSKALVDISKMTGNPSIIDRYETGVEISKYWGAKIQVASVVEESLINFVAETVAVNRGANFKVFSEIGPALEWLEVDEPKSG
jgi:hypothetical protein